MMIRVTCGLFWQVLCGHRKKGALSKLRSVKDVFVADGFRQELRVFHSSCPNPVDSHTSNSTPTEAHFRPTALG